MKQVNLLPWRELNKTEQKRDFIFRAAVSVVIAILIILLMHWHYSQERKLRLVRNDFLTAAINQEQSQVNDLLQQKKSLLKIKNDLNFVLSLQAKSFQAVTMLNTLIKAVPENLNFTKIQRENNRVIITGKTVSEHQITELINNLAQFNTFKQPDLSKIARKSNDSSDEVIFNLKIEQKE